MRRALLHGLHGLQDDLAAACIKARKLVDRSSAAHAALLWGDIKSRSASWHGARAVAAAVALASLLPWMRSGKTNAQQRQELASMLDSLAAALRMPTLPPPPSEGGSGAGQPT